MSYKLYIRWHNLQNTSKWGWYVVELPNHPYDPIQETHVGAFFMSGTGVRPNRTDVRLFMSMTVLSLTPWMRSELAAGGQPEATFGCMEEFFEYIGYDPKTKTYSSGEVPFDLDNLRTKQGD